MALKLVQFFAIVLTAITLIPVGAHFFELWNKIGLDREPYFVVQGIYRGWALFGFVVFPALAANIILAVMLRRRTSAFVLAAAAAVGIAATLAIFFTWIYPANLATDNWTVAPANWAELRTRWEYAHATNAVITFLALCAAVLASLSGREEGRA
jgi:hypothetical protein